MLHLQKVVFYRADPAGAHPCFYILEYNRADPTSVWFSCSVPFTAPPDPSDYKYSAGLSLLHYLSYASYSDAVLVTDNATCHALSLLSSLRPDSVSYRLWASTSLSHPPSLSLCGLPSARLPTARHFCDAPPYPRGGLQQRHLSREPSIAYTRKVSVELEYENENRIEIKK